RLDIVLVLRRVIRQQALDQRARCVFALGGADRGQVRQERSVGRDKAQSLLPFGSGHFEQRGGQVVFRQHVGIVRDHSRAARHADPLAFSRAKTRLNAVQNVRGQRGETVVVGRQTERPGILREEYVGGRVLAFF